MRSSLPGRPTAAADPAATQRNNGSEDEIYQQETTPFESNRTSLELFFTNSLDTKYTMA
jgi:hypothetical protein